VYYSSPGACNGSNSRLNAKYAVIRNGDSSTPSLGGPCGMRQVTAIRSAPSGCELSRMVSARKIACHEPDPNVTNAVAGSCGATRVRQDRQRAGPDRSHARGGPVPRSAVLPDPDRGRHHRYRHDARFASASPALTVFGVAAVCHPGSPCVTVVTGLETLVRRLWRHCDDGQKALRLSPRHAERARP
jgi:hypothetical protein